MIIDGGDCAVGIESTIISLVEERSVILRPGGVPAEDIEAVIGPVARGAESAERLEAPGQLPHHYSPSIPVELAGGLSTIDFSRGDAGYLLFRRPDFEVPVARTEILSINGDLKEASANFFSALHRLDGMNIQVIIAEPVPEAGLGVAIMDRLRKAARKSAGNRSSHERDKGMKA
jgi:L-threonylcarbamoyladenylate synthase